MKRLLSLLLTVALLFSLSACSQTKSFSYAAEFENDEMQSKFEEAMIKRLSAFSVPEDEIVFSQKEKNGEMLYQLKVSSRSFSEKEAKLLFSDKDFIFCDYELTTLLDQNDIKDINIAYDLSLVEEDPNDSGYYLKITLTDSGIALLSEQTLRIANLAEAENRFLWIYFGDEFISQCSVEHRLMQKELAISGFKELGDAEYARACFLSAANPLPSRVSLK